MYLLNEFDESIRSSLTHIAIEKTYVPVQVDKPSMEALSAVLYAGKSYQFSSHDPSGAPNKVFIEQWNVLIKKLNAVLKVHLNYKNFSDILIPQPDNTVMTLEERLTREITKSIQDKEAGLLPNQSPIAFTHLKRYLEEICFYFSSKEKNAVDIGPLRDLAENLHMCGPGLFQDAQAASDAIYKAEGLYAWLMECRTEIVRQEADLTIARRNTPKGWEVHVTTAFFDYAKKKGWQLSLGDVDLSDSYSMNVTRVDDLNRLDSTFIARYSVEAIPYLVERAKTFLREWFALFSEHDNPEKISLEKMSEFLEKTKGVLSSLGLSQQLFLEMDEECTHYTLKLSDMDVMIREGLSKLGLIPLAVDVSVVGFPETARVFQQVNFAVCNMVYGIKNNASMPPDCVTLFFYHNKYYTPKNFAAFFFGLRETTFIYLLLAALKKYHEMRQFRDELIDAIFEKKIENNSSLSFDVDLQDKLLRSQIFLSPDELNATGKVDSLNSKENFYRLFNANPEKFVQSLSSEALFIFFKRHAVFKDRFLDFINTATFEFKKTWLSLKFIDLVRMDENFFKTVVAFNTEQLEQVQNYAWILFFILNGASENLSSDDKKSFFNALEKINENEGSRSKFLDLVDDVIRKHQNKLINLLQFFEKNPSLTEEGSVILKFILDRPIAGNVINTLFKFYPSKVPILFTLAKNKKEFISSLYFEIDYSIKTKVIPLSKVAEAFFSLPILFEAAKVDARYLIILLYIKDFNALLENYSVELIDVLTTNPASLEILGMQSPKFFYDILKYIEKKPDLTELSKNVIHTFLMLEKNEYFVENLARFLNGTSYSYSLPVSIIKPLLTLMRKNSKIKESVLESWAEAMVIVFAKAAGVIFDKITNMLVENIPFNEHDIRLLGDYLSTMASLYEFKYKKTFAHHFYKPYDVLAKETLHEILQCVEKMVGQNPCHADIKGLLIKLRDVIDQNLLRYHLLELIQKLLNLNAAFEGMHNQAELTIVPKS